MFVTSQDIKDKVYSLYKNGIKRGVSIGWRSFDDAFTIIKGTTTYLAGPASHGKTVFWLNVLINLSKKYGYKHAIFSPETGDPHNIVSLIMEIWSGKSFDKTKKGCITDSEIYTLAAEISEYFYIIELEDNQRNLKGFLAECDRIIRDFNIDTIMIDPWNEFRHDLTGGREDKYLEETLTDFRNWTKKAGVHSCILAHPRSDKTRSRQHPGVATMYDFSGGEAWPNKAMNVLSVHRPLNDDEGRVYPKHNQSDIYIQKVKPKEVGEKGMVSLWFDKVSSRFYEKNDLGREYFAWEKPKGHYNNPVTGGKQDKPFDPNEEFLTPTGEEPPF